MKKQAFKLLEKDSEFNVMVMATPSKMIKAVVEAGRLYELYEGKNKNGAIITKSEETGKIEQIVNHPDFYVMLSKFKKLTTTQPAP